MQKLCVRLLKLWAQVHDKLVHPTGLLMTLNERTHVRTRECMCNHHLIRSRREFINLMPDTIVAAIKLSNGIVALLKPTEYLIHSIQLCLTRSTVMSCKVIPHVLDSG